MRKRTKIGIGVTAIVAVLLILLMPVTVYVRAGDTLIIGDGNLDLNSDHTFIFMKVTRGDGSVEYYEGSNVITNAVNDTPPPPVADLPPFIRWIIPTDEFPFIQWYHVLIAAVLVTAYKIRQNKEQEAVYIIGWAANKCRAFGRWVKRGFWWFIALFEEVYE
jgi:hypothetical protein